MLRRFCARSAAVRSKAMTQSTAREPQARSSRFKAQTSGEAKSDLLGKQIFTPDFVTSHRLCHRPPPVQVVVGGVACSNPHQPSSPALQQKQVTCTLAPSAGGLRFVCFLRYEFGSCVVQRICQCCWCKISGSRVRSTSLSATRAADSEHTAKARTASLVLR